MNMRLRYFVVKREPTTYCGLNLVDTPDVDISAPPAPTAPLGRVTAAVQVFLCCGQVATQGLIAVVLMLCGVKYMDGDQVSLPFFAALTLIDTAVVVFMMFVFLSASRESFRAVFIGSRDIKKEITTGLLLVPVVLIGMGIVMSLLRLAFPGLHNVKVSPFDSYTDTPFHAALFLFTVIVAGGVREELQRGFLLHRFDQRLGGIWVGQILYTVGFGIAHAIQGWDAALTIGALGFFWGWLYIKRRSVIAGMVSHAGFNATEVLLQIFAKAAGIKTP